MSLISSFKQLNSTRLKWYDFETGGPLPGQNYSVLPCCQTDFEFPRYLHSLQTLQKYDKNLPKIVNYLTKRIRGEEMEEFTGGEDVVTLPDDVVSLFKQNPEALSFISKITNEKAYPELPDLPGEHWSLIL